MLVARGQGLIAVINPSTNAEKTGMLLFSINEFKNSNIISFWTIELLFFALTLLKKRFDHALS